MPRTLRTRLAAASLLLAAPNGSAHALSASEVFAKVSPSVVIVESQASDSAQRVYGSGVVIARGEVITNCHILRPAGLHSTRVGKSQHRATLRYADQERDLCQLSSPTLTAPPILLGSVKNLRPGDKVIAIGNPQGLELSISEGIVSGIREDRGGQIIQSTAQISKGSSGGGLFDSEARLVGITTAYLVEGQNLNFATPVDGIAELPKRNRRLVAENVARKPSSTIGRPDKDLTSLRKYELEKQAVHYRELVRTVHVTNAYWTWLVLADTYADLGWPRELEEVYQHILSNKIYRLAIVQGKQDLERWDVYLQYARDCNKLYMDASACGLRALDMYFSEWKETAESRALQSMLFAKNKQTDLAIAAAHRVRDLGTFESQENNRFVYPLLLAFAYSVAGDLKQAKEPLQRAKTLSPNWNEFAAKVRLESLSLYDYLSKIEKLER